MGTKLPRIQVVLKPSSAKCVFRIAALTEQSRSAIVSQIVQASLPALMRMVEGLEDEREAFDRERAARVQGSARTRPPRAAALPPHANRGVVNPNPLKGKDAAGARPGFRGR